MEVLKEHIHFGGNLRYCRHASQTTQCEMGFSVFTPPGEGPFPVLWWLSGLTCTEDNFTVKAGAYRHAAEHRLIVVAPDTSPRGDSVADDDAYDLGQGAGFYVDAQQEPWSKHFLMYSYITGELNDLVCASFPVDSSAQGISGHSMGGHGALTIALKNPDRYRSISAFAPIVAPTQVPWGHKAFSNYLGEDQSTWDNYDACKLIARQSDRSAFPPILIDQGLADDFLTEQLVPEKFSAACETVGQKLELRMQPGYDHSYFFIATFIEDHIEHHARLLRT